LSLRRANLEDIVKRAERLAELVLEMKISDPVIPQYEAQDLLSRIWAHEAIHG
jgi:hypothetical protein